MLYFVHEIGPFHGQLSPEVLLVHGNGSFHGQIPLELIFVHETGAFHGRLSPEVLLVHGNGSFHGQAPRNPSLSMRPALFMDEPSGASAYAESRQFVGR
jgi:hypothetical protein